MQPSSWQHGSSGGTGTQFSGFLCELQIHTHGLDLDPLACGLALAMTALLILGTHETAVFNLVVTVLHVAVILFVIGAGLSQADPANLRPFAPFGVSGVLQGATTAFFAYIGADALANTAEEVHRPSFPLSFLFLPIGVGKNMRVQARLLYLLTSMAQEQ